MNASRTYALAALYALFALAALCPLVTAAQDGPPASGAAPAAPVIRRATRQPQFQIPFSVDRSSSEIAEVRLYMSLDRGRTWQVADAKPPTAQGFPFRAASDGVYWFASRIVDKQQQLWPQRPLAPELEVWVDTTEPQLDLHATQRGSQLELAWSAWDPLLYPQSLQIEYFRDGKWQPTQLEPRNTGGRLEGVVVIPRDILEVRAIASDQAGNRAVISRSVDGGTAVASTPPSPPSSSAPGSSFTALAAMARAPFSNTSGSIPSDPMQAVGGTSQATAPGTKDVAPAASLADKLGPPPVYQPQAPAAATSDKGAGQPPAWAPRSETFAETRQAWPASSTATMPGAPAPLASRSGTAIASDLGGSVPWADAAPQVSATELGNGSPYRPVSSPVAPAFTQQQLGTGLAVESNQPSSGAPSPPPMPADESTAAPPLAPTPPGDAAPTTVMPVPGSVTSTAPSGAARPTEAPAARGLTTKAEPNPNVRPQWSNRTRFSIDYQLNSIQPENVGEVELWATADQGATWSRWGTDPDKQSPVSVKIEDEGIYGFRVVVVSRRGMASPRPQRDSDADVWVGVDVTRPQIEVTSAANGFGDQAGRLEIRWEAHDSNLPERPISLAYGATPAGPWTDIATEMEDTGRYLWLPMPTTPDKVYLHIKVTDSAGNVGEHTTPQPIQLHGLRPRASIRAVLPRDGSPETAPST